MDRVQSIANKSPVVIFSLSSCCMCHTVKRLFAELGTDPYVHELDHDPRRKELEMALIKLLGREPAAPAVFIGGRLVGATDKVFTEHLSGVLKKSLEKAGALQGQ